MRTWRILESRAVEGAVRDVAMKITMAKVRRTCRVATDRSEKGRERTIGKGKEWGRQRRNGRETVKGKVL